MKEWVRWMFFTWSSFFHAPWDTGISPPELIQFITTHSPGMALDMGCGTGTNAITLAKAGWQATGVDFVARSISSARKKGRSAGVKVNFIVDSVTRMDALEDQFDLILDIGCFQGLPESGKLLYLANLDRLLAPNGSFMIYGFIQDEALQTFGLTPSWLDRLSKKLQLIKREDSPGNRGRPSTWMTFQRAGDDVWDNYSHL
jgi:ubiquinone/menaquinone biosynthesis C-methylase UbiE